MKKRSIIICLISISLLLMFLLSIIQIDGTIQLWDLEYSGSMWNPLIMGFSGVLFFVVISNEYLTKSEYRAVIVGTLWVVLWEVVAEVVGWYFKWWAFAADTTNVIEVLKAGLHLGVLMGTGWLYFSLIYIGIWRLFDGKQKRIPTIIVYFVLTTVGWFADMGIGYTTYVVTYIVWMCLNGVHLLILYYIINSTSEEINKHPQDGNN